MALLVGCRIENTPRGDNSVGPGGGGGGQGGGGSVTNNVLVGSWSSSTSAPDPWNSFNGGMGGAGSGERLDFAADGTYAYVMVGASSVVEFAIGDKGSYEVNGDKVTFYDRRHTFENYKDPSASFSDRPMDAGTASFRIETDGSGRKTLVVYGVDSSGQEDVIYGPMQYQGG